MAAAGRRREQAWAAGGQHHCPWDRHCLVTHPRDLDGASASRAQPDPLANCRLLLSRTMAFHVLPGAWGQGHVHS